MSEVPSDDRLDELETRVAFQDDQLLCLSREVADLQLRFYRVLEEMLRMREAMAGMRATSDGVPERPPHY